jgi:hypothetical protein
MKSEKKKNKKLKEYKKNLNFSSRKTSQCESKIQKQKLRFLLCTQNEAKKKYEFESTLATLKKNMLHVLLFANCTHKRPYVHTYKRI